ncbi:MAG: hypothetical protein ACI36W_04200 [Coriobacteriales bacterium]
MDSAQSAGKGTPTPNDIATIWKKGFARLLDNLSDRTRVILTIAVAAGMVFFSIYMYTTYG